MQMRSKQKTDKSVRISHERFSCRFSSSKTENSRMKWHKKAAIMTTKAIKAQQELDLGGFTLIKASLK